jgi:hypothetical protein
MGDGYDNDDSGQQRRIEVYVAKLPSSVYFQTSPLALMSMY